MVRRLTPLWTGLIAAANLVLGVVSMYFFVVAGQRRIEKKIDQVQLAAPVAAQPAAVVPPAPTTGSGRVHAKVHGRSPAVPKSKPQLEEPAPPAPDQP